MESELWGSGARYVVGLDEVGRGAWAGPVSVGAAVIAEEAVDSQPSSLADSKEIPRARRIAAFDQVASWLIDGAVGHASAAECDRHGLRVALALAARRALAKLDVRPDAMLIDGPFDITRLAAAESTVLERSLGSAQLPARVVCVVRGDRRCASIAAASVLAKVTRDRLLVTLDRRFGGYGFASNMGYPAPVHRRRLDEHGVTPEHRLSWSFARELPGGVCSEPVPTLFDHGT